MLTGWCCCHLAWKNIHASRHANQHLSQYHSHQVPDDTGTTSAVQNHVDQGPDHENVKTWQHSRQPSLPSHWHFPQREQTCSFVNSCPFHVCWEHFSNQAPPPFKYTQWHCSLGNRQKWCPAICRLYPSRLTMQHSHPIRGKVNYIIKRGQLTAPIRRLISDKTISLICGQGGAALRVGQDSKLCVRASRRHFPRES